jgi:hypothetical protein
MLGGGNCDVESVVRARDLSRVEADCPAAEHPVLELLARKKLVQRR